MNKKKTQYVYFISYNFSDKKGGSGFGCWSELGLDYEIDNGSKVLEVINRIKEENDFKGCAILNFILLRKEKKDE